MEQLILTHNTDGGGDLLLPHSGAVVKNLIAQGDPSIIAVVSAGLAAAGLWLGNRLLGRAAMQTAVNEMARVILEELRGEKRALQEALHLERLQNQLDQQALRSEINGLKQTIASLEELLRRAGIDIPRGRNMLPQEMIVLPTMGGADELE